jgi:hypothetical protein
MTGSMAARRLNSRLICDVTRRLLVARVDFELVIGWGVVAAIAGIGDAAIEDVADERLHLRNDRAERVPVISASGEAINAVLTAAG